MLLRCLVLCLAVILIDAGIGFSLEPVRTNISVTDLVLQVAKGKAVVAVPTAKPVPAAQSVKPPAGRAQTKRSTARAVLPPVVGLPAQGQVKFSDLANRERRSVPPSIHATSVPGTLKAVNISAVPAKSSPAHRKTPHQAGSVKGPRVRAKALYCVDFSSNRVVLAQNSSEPLPIASITKLLTAMTVIDEMPMEKVITVPEDIREVPRHRVGLRPGDRLTVRDLLHGMLIESGNDCAEALARSYPKGGREGFMAALNRKAARIGARTALLYTPSGLDQQFIVGRKGGRDLDVRKYNQASAKDVALIARHAFGYPLIRQIATTKNYTMRTRNFQPHTYALATNDKLLLRNLPVEGAKTGYTNLAGRCIVALFKDEGKEHMVVVLNTPKHFKAAERIYRWAARTF